ncbi:F-box/FBD/LRR-repeat protein At4g26340-like isoform X1 [Pistacia vera]|uniref:F-box/FBD/LRR-repeat protein At4g26340-like isoform X1 n=2 Tax=Pistacia vera TaxID=55513 RepID=UPI001263597D|nr:F-box/FBD/LRR-repeat protein At4g26340-like isoform X1 [Pistacia vera]
MGYSGCDSMENRIDNLDRISALPDEILHHILSFVSLKQAVRTSVLSKSWKETWHTCPILVLEDHPHRDIARVKEVLKFMEQTLLNRHMEMISLRKLMISLAWFWDDKFAALVDRCVCFAIGSNVKELKLRFPFFWGRYNLPQIVFCAKSINVLELDHCTLSPPRIGVQLSLRKLCLVGVYVDDQMIENLFARCPLIECLTIESSKGFKSLELFSLRKLHEVEISSNAELKKVEINALNVHSVTITNMETCVINVACCKNLKCLVLSDLSITDDWLCNVISDFSLLQFLSITYCHKLRSIKISCPSLKELVIIGCDLVEVKLETPNLSIFRFHGHPISFTSNAMALSETDLYIYGYDDDIQVDIQVLVKYIELLAKFNQCSEVLNLGHCTGAVVIVPREWRQILHPPLCGVRHLNLLIDDDLFDFTIPQLVDSLLWLSPHIVTISMSFPLGHRHEYSFQFLYKEQLIHKAENPSCCQSLPISCWQNCLKGVKIEHTATYFAQPASVDRFSLERKTSEKRSYGERFYFHDNIWDELNNLHLNLRNKFSYLFDGDK